MRIPFDCCRASKVSASNQRLKSHGSSGYWGWWGRNPRTPTFDVLELFSSFREWCTGDRSDRITVSAVRIIILFVQIIANSKDFTWRRWTTCTFINLNVRAPANCDLIDSLISIFTPQTVRAPVSNPDAFRPPASHVECILRGVLLGRTVRRTVRWWVRYT